MLLIVALFCYGIFWLKSYLLRQKINEVDAKIAIYGTDQQKRSEQGVLDSKKRVDDFAGILNNHTISANVFSFIEEKTLPNVWFSSFSMAESIHEIRLAGEADTMEILSRQFRIFEESKEQVKSITIFNSQLVPSGKIKFILNIALDPKIFNYQTSTNGSQ